VFFAILKFYKLDLSPKDLRKDLVINMLTSFIMRPNIYLVLMNIIVATNKKRLSKINKNMKKY